MKQKKIFYIMIYVILLVFGASFLIIFFKNPPWGGVWSYGPLKIGGLAPELPGDSTSYPFRYIPFSKKFYVSIVQYDVPTSCIFDDCGPNGKIVECMNGWLSGDDQIEFVDNFGLNIDDVESGKSTMVVVSNSKAKIMGIYPSHTMNDLPSILNNYWHLRKSLKQCLKVN